MAAYIVPAFILIPLVEVGVFIEFGAWIGLWPTLGTILCTGLVGTVLIRRQGFRTFEQAKISLQKNRAPLREIFDALCFFVSGLLLLTPGFLTDVFGCVLLIPFVRAHIRQIIARRLNHPPKRERNGDRGPVIEGEYQRIRPKDDPKRGSN